MVSSMASMILEPVTYTKRSTGLSFQDEGFLWKNKVLLLPLAFGAAALVGWKIYTNAMKKRKYREISLAQPNLVILHQFPRGFRAPSISPFPLKLETFLRMTGIPYVNDFENFRGPKGKCPYITLNGEEIGDSQLIMEHLKKTYQKNLDKGLSDWDKAVGHAFRIMTENHLYWSLALYRWVFDPDRTIMKVSKWPSPLGHFVYFLIHLAIKRAAGYHGIGRHSKEEIMEMLVKDLTAISTFLGTKSYFMGDQPSEVDCAMFGLLSQFVWNFPDTPVEKLVIEDFPNIKAYCFRMKERFWPDWNDCLSANQQ